MAQKLKARRVTGGVSPVVYVLTGVVVLLLGVIGYLLMGQDDLTLEERNYQAMLGELVDSPEDPVVLMTLAKQEIALGKNAEARGHAAKALEFGSEVRGIPFAYAEVMISLGDLEEARKGIEAEMVLDVRNQDPEPLFLLAQIQRAEGDLEEALESMEIAFVIDQTDADMRLVYGQMLEEAGRTEEAIGQYQEALRFTRPGEALHDGATSALARLGVTVETTVQPDPHATQDETR